MARARLHGDPGYHDSLTIAALSEDHSPCVEEVDPGGTVQLTVRMRTRDGYTDDGDPRYTWEDVVTGPAIVWEERAEVDGAAGITQVLATATLLYEGSTEVNESAIVVAPWAHYRVVGAGQFPDRLEFELMRVEGTDDSEG